MEFKKLEKEEIKKQLMERESERFAEYLVSNNDYYATKDGYYIEIEKANKLSIEKTIYYDDETEAPKINFENFKNYNDAVFARLEYLKEKASLAYEHFYLAHNSICDEKNAHVVVLDNWADDLRKQYIIRELTHEEKVDYLIIMEKRANDYLERLKKYYNRYQKHITTCGYWANR